MNESDQQPTGEERMRWLAKIKKRVVDGCSPAVAAKYGSAILIEAGVPRDIVESLKIIDRV